MHFHPALAPVKIGVLPLSKKLNEGAEKVFAELSKKYNCEFDDRGNIGKRYRRQDEIGTPYCITYDFDSETVTPWSRRELKLRISMLTLQINLLSNLAF